MTKAELRQMLTEAVRNTPSVGVQPKPLVERNGIADPAVACVD